MSTRSNTTFTEGQKKDALRLAKGLFESKVLVNRPPTAAQRATYNAGRPWSVQKSACGSKKIKSTKLQKHLVNPVWRPFGQDKSLNQVRREIHCGRESRTKSGSNPTQAEDYGASHKTSRLPNGICSLEPWITEENVEPWTGIPAHPNCFVILPSGFHSDVNCLPPLQSHEDTLVEQPADEIKKYIPPKILHNYNYLEKEDSLQYQHDRKQCGKSEATSRKSTKRLRTSEIIEQEIQDFEQLLQGYGNPSSSSIVNRYQYEITKLKEMVIETLRDYTFDVDIPKELESTIFHGDLFEFLARHDEIIAAIKEKRDACVNELSRLQQELRLEDSTSGTNIEQFEQNTATY